VVKESPSQRQADLDRPFVTDEEMSAFTMEQNAKKLNRAKGFIDKLGAQSTRQKLFVADLVEDAGEGIFDNVDMGAVVRSNMFDDLIEQGIDDDLLTKIMYSDTKSDDFAITLAKIKSNAADEGIDIASGTGVDINETIDFYGRVFDEVSRVKKSMGGRIGFADGPDDPKKLIKKVPKVGKVVSGIESLKGAIGKIMNKFGEDAITTADKVDQPEKTTQQLISEFEARNKPDAIKIESRESGTWTDRFNISSAGAATFSNNLFARRGSFGTASNFSFDLYNNGTSYFNGAVTIDDNATITNSGNIKIGSSTTVTPATQADDIVIDKGASESGITIVSTAAASLRFGDAASASVGYIEYNHSSNAFSFGTNGATRLTISSAGDVKVTSGSFYNSVSGITKIGNAGDYEFIDPLGS
jgi:hypothetical protein